MVFVMDNRLQKCKNNLGGVNEFYIFEWEKYNRSQIIVEENILQQFPSTTIFNLNGKNITFTESIDEEEGGVFYSQTGGFELQKLQKWDNYKKFAQKDWRIILKDRNGNYRLIGLQNGVKIKFTKETGNAISDFNGFKFTFENKEEETAPFFYDLNAFFDVYINPLALQVELQEEI